MARIRVDCDRCCEFVIGLEGEQVNFVRVQLSPFLHKNSTYLIGHAGSSGVIRMRTKRCRGARADGSRRLGTDENLVLSVFNDHGIAVQLNTIAGHECALSVLARRESNESIAFTNFHALDHLPVGVKYRLQMRTGGVRGQIADEELAGRYLGMIGR